MSKDLVKTSNPEQLLSVREEMRLAALEQLMVKDFAAFYRVGQALAEINESRLYRITPNGKSRTFEQYCKEIHDLAKGTARRYIAAAKTYENVSNWRQIEGGNNGDVIELLPINEAQIRPLTRLRPDQQIQVWQAAVRTARGIKGGKPTAAHVKHIVDQFIGGEAGAKIKKVRQAVEETKTFSGEFKDAFNVFTTAIMNVKAGGYKDASREEIADCLAALGDIIREDGLDLGERAILGGSKDANKLEKAGYILLRTDRSSMTIKERAGGGWKKSAGPFDTVKEMETEFAALLQDDKHLAG